MTALKKTHRKLRQGGYLAATTAIVVAIVVFLNLIVGQLPTHLLEFDLSDKQLYTVTDTSKEFLAGLDKDVEIVVLAEESNVDERIAKFLDNYAALSSHITVTEVDPVAPPLLLRATTRRSTPWWSGVRRRVRQGLSPLTTSSSMTRCTTTCTARSTRLSLTLRAS